MAMVSAMVSTLMTSFNTSSHITDDMCYTANSTKQWKICPPEVVIRYLDVSQYSICNSNISMAYCEWRGYKTILLQRQRLSCRMVKQYPLRTDDLSTSDFYGYDLYKNSLNNWSFRWMEGGIMDVPLSWKVLKGKRDTVKKRYSLRKLRPTSWCAVSNFSIKKPILLKRGQSGSAYGIPCKQVESTFYDTKHGRRNSKAIPCPGHSGWRRRCQRWKSAKVHSTTSNLHIVRHADWRDYFKESKTGWGISVFIREKPKPVCWLEVSYRTLSRISLYRVGFDTFNHSRDLPPTGSNRQWKPVSGEHLVVSNDRCIIHSQLIVFSKSKYFEKTFEVYTKVSWSHTFGCHV